MTLRLSLLLPLIVVTLSCASNGSRQGTIELQAQRRANVATSQPATVSQDQAALIARIAALENANISLRSEITGIRNTKFEKTTYSDLTLGGVAIVLSFLLFIVAMVWNNRQSKRHARRFAALRSFPDAHP